MNSIQMHYSQLKKSALKAEGKKKKKLKRVLHPDMDTKRANQT